MVTLTWVSRRNKMHPPFLSLQLIPIHITLLCWSLVLSSRYTNSCIVSHISYLVIKFQTPYHLNWNGIQSSYECVEKVQKYFESYGMECNVSQQRLLTQSLAKIESQMFLTLSLFKKKEPMLAKAPWTYTRCSWRWDEGWGCHKSERSSPGACCLI